MKIQSYSTLDSAAPASTETSSAQLPEHTAAGLPWGRLSLCGMACAAAAWAGFSHPTTTQKLQDVVQQYWTAVAMEQPAFPPPAATQAILMPVAAPAPRTEVTLPKIQIAATLPVALPEKIEKQSSAGLQNEIVNLLQQAEQIQNTLALMEARLTPPATPEKAEAAEGVENAMPEFGRDMQENSKANVAVPNMEDPIAGASASVPVDLQPHRSVQASSVSAIAVQDAGPDIPLPELTEHVARILPAVVVQEDARPKQREDMPGHLPLALSQDIFGNDVAPHDLPVVMPAAAVVPPAVQTKPAVPAPPPAKPTDVARDHATKPAMPQPLAPEFLATILRRAEAQLSAGDISAARLLYTYAAQSGSGAAAAALGRTYDPAYLASLGVQGIRPDAEAAAYWYRQALAQGESQVAALLTQLQAR